MDHSNRIELATHFLTVLRGPLSEATTPADPQSPFAFKRALLIQLRDEAIEYLKPIQAKILRTLPEHIRKKYQEEKISLDWNLTDPDDAIEFSLTATRRDHAQNLGDVEKIAHEEVVPHSLVDRFNLTASQTSAALLLYFCTHALEQNAVDDRLAARIVTAYIGLDLDTLAIGHQRRLQQSESGKQPRLKVGPAYAPTTISQIVATLATAPEFTEHTAHELWPKFFAKLDELQVEPEEVHAANSKKRAITYDFGDKRRTMKFTTFSNAVSTARTKSSHLPR